CGKRLPGAFSARPAARDATESTSPAPTLGPAVYRKGNDPAGRPGALGWGAARAGLGLGVAGCVFLLLHLLALAAIGPASWPAPLPSRGAGPYLLIALALVGAAGVVLVEACAWLVGTAPPVGRTPAVPVCLVLKWLALAVVLACSGANAAIQARNDQRIAE